MKLNRMFTQIITVTAVSQNQEHPQDHVCVKQYQRSVVTKHGANGQFLPKRYA